VSALRRRAPLQKVLDLCNAVLPRAVPELARRELALDLGPLVVPRAGGARPLARRADVVGGEVRRAVVPLGLIQTAAGRSASRTHTGGAPLAVGLAAAAVGCKHARTRPAGATVPADDGRTASDSFRRGMRTRHKGGGGAPAGDRRWRTLAA